MDIGRLIELLILKSGSNVPAVEDDPVCMWLPCIRGYILHFSLQHILFTLTLIAPALHVCNKCYSLLYLCIVIFSVPTWITVGLFHCLLPCIYIYFH